MTGGGRSESTGLDTGSPRARRWLVVKTTPWNSEEGPVLAALARAAERSGRTLAVMLLGSASYSVNAAPLAPGRPHLECWALEEDVRGRGIRCGVGVRVVRYPELVRSLFEAEKVIQFS